MVTEPFIVNILHPHRINTTLKFRGDNRGEITEFGKEIMRNLDIPLNLLPFKLYCIASFLRRILRKSYPIIFKLFFSVCYSNIDIFFFPNEFVVCVSNGTSQTPLQHFYYTRKLENLTIKLVWIWSLHWFFVFCRF